MKGGLKEKNLKIIEEKMLRDFSLPERTPIVPPEIKTRKKSAKREAWDKQRGEKSRL